MKRQATPLLSRLMPRSRSSHIAAVLALVLAIVCGAVAQTTQCFTAVYDYGRQSVPLTPVTVDPATGATITNSLEYLTRGQYAVVGTSASTTGYEERDTETLMIVQAGGRFDLLLTHDQNGTDTDGFNFYLQVTVASGCDSFGNCAGGLVGNSSVLAAAFQNTPYLTANALAPQSCALSPTYTYEQATANFSRGACCAATGSCCGRTSVCGQFDECVGAGSFYVYKEVNPVDPKPDNAALWLGHLPTATAGNEYCINLEYSHQPSQYAGITHVKFVGAPSGFPSGGKLARALAGNSIAICARECASADAPVANYCSRHAGDCGACNSDPACGFCGGQCVTRGACPSPAACSGCGGTTCASCTAVAGCGWCPDTNTCTAGNRRTGVPQAGTPAACKRWIANPFSGATSPLCPNAAAPKGTLPGDAATDELFPLYASSFQSNLIGWSAADVTLTTAGSQSPVFSQWLVSDGFLIQSSSIREGFGTAASAGTWFYYQPGIDQQWVSYTVSAAIRSQGENYQSVAFRWTSERRYYEFEWANANPLAGACLGRDTPLGAPAQVLRTMRLKKVVDGVPTVLASKVVGYDTQTRYTVHIVVFETFGPTQAAEATQIVVFVNAAHVWTLTDTDAFRPLYGTVAAATAGEQSASFGTFAVAMVASPLGLPTAGAQNTTGYLKAPLWSYYTFRFDPVQYAAAYPNGFVFTVQLANHDTAPSGIQDVLNGLGAGGFPYSAYGSEIYLHYGGGSSSQAALPTPTNYRAAQKTSGARQSTVTLSVPSAAFLAQNGPWYIGVYNSRWTGGTAFAPQRFQLTTGMVAIQSALVGFPNQIVGDARAVNLYSLSLQTLAGFLQFKVTRGDPTGPTSGTQLRVLVSVGGAIGTGYPPSPSLDSLYDFSDDHTGNQDNAATYFGDLPLTVRIPNPAVSAYYVSVYATSVVGPETAVPASLAVPFNLTITVPNPTIVSVNPVQASTDGGSPLTIIGFDFLNGGSVTVGGVPCLIQSPTTDYTATQIACSLPAGQGANRTVVVTTNAGLATDPAKPTFFSYLPPLVQAINPFNAPTTAGSTVTLTGQNFGADPAQVAVRVGGKPCPVVPGTPPRGTIYCVLPAGQGAAVSLEMLVGGQPAAAGSVSAFAYDAPVITLVDPLNGPSEYTFLTITGRNFGSADFGNDRSATSSYVTVGADVCDFTQSDPRTVVRSTNHSQVVCRVPPGVGRKNLVTVHVAGQSSNTQLFDYDAPRVLSVAPAVGPTTGVRITVMGANFGPSSAADFAVSLYNPVTTITTPCADAVHLNDSAIACSAPAGTGVNLVAQVTVAGQDVPTNAAPAYFSYAVPTVSQVAPDTGAAVGGTTITVFGSNFGPTPIAGVVFVLVSVTVGGAPCTVVTQFHTNVTCVVPAGSGANVPVLVTVDGQSSTANPSSVFTYATPGVTGISPSTGSAAGGYLVTVSGHDFGPNSGVGQVLVGSATCTVAFPHHWTDAQIVCTLPGGSGTANVQVNVNGVLSTGATQFVYGTPQVLEIAPRHAPTYGAADPNTVAWVSLTVAGTNFGPAQGTGFVRIGSRTCQVQAWSNTQVLCWVPAGEGTALPVVLQDAAGQINTTANAFSYDAPVITGYSPAVLPTTVTAVTLVGYNFGDGAASGSYSAELVTACYAVDEFDANTVQNGTWSYAYDPAAFSQGFVYDSGAAVKTGLDSLLFVGDQLPRGGQWNVRVVAPTRPVAPALCTNVPVTVWTDATSNPTSTTVNLASGAGQIGPFTFAIGSARVLIGTAGTASCTVAVDAVRFCPVAAPLAVAGSAFAAHGHTAIVVPIPAGVGTDFTVALTTPQGVATTATGLVNATLTFARAKPTLNAGSPSVAAPAGANPLGGDVVTFAGSGFGTDASAIAVWFGRLGGNAALCSGVTLASDSSFTCTAPAWPVGGLSVAVLVQIGGQRVASTLSYAAPTVGAAYANGASCNGGPATGALNLLVRGGTQICFQATGALAGNTVVEYGVADGMYCASKGSVGCTPGWVFPCTSVTVTGGNVQCTTTGGGGAGLRVRLRVGAVTSDWSSFTLAYPAPRFVAATIRLNVPYALGNVSIADPSTQGNWIVADGHDFPTDPALWDILAITYSNAQNPTVALPCESVEVWSTVGPAPYLYTPPTDAATRAAVRCKTTPGSGLNYTFTPYALTLKGTPSTDLYSYVPPVQPVVTAVLGCPTTVGASTADCLAASPYTLTVQGTGFCEFSREGSTCSVTVKVGSVDCTSPASRSASELTCTLAAGTGQNLPVVVVMDGNFSPLNPNVTVSRATAVVTNLQSDACTRNVGPPITLTQCPASYQQSTLATQSTGAMLTVTGANFGASGATVLVGSQLCTGVSHAVADTQLICALPPGLGAEGTGQGLSVTVIPVGGGTTVPDANAPTVSYATCPNGFYRVMDARGRQTNSTCAPCPAGSFSATATATACAQCESGSFMPLMGQSVCAQCGAGTYSVRSADGKGAQSCTQCPAGSYSLAPTLPLPAPGNSFCTPCAANTYSANPGLNTVCPACPTSPEQTVSGGGATSCTPCPVGTVYSATSGLCTPVPVGRYGTFDATGKISLACAAGSIAPYAGMTACTMCPNGTATAALPLNGGGYATCFPCNSGFYQPNANATACLQCPLGTARKNDGRPAVACDVCVAGTYQNGQSATGPFGALEGPVTCLKCEKGTYQDSPNAVSCMACPAGRATRLLGATVCGQCQAGTYAVTPTLATGMVQCAACETGRYSTELGKTTSSCTPCPAGEYQDLTGQKQCKICPAGRSAEGSGQAGCRLCDPGSFADGGAVTAAKCEVCPIGKWSAAGASSCTDALPGFVVASPNQGSSAACPPGSFADGFRASVCGPCERGKYATNAGSSTCLECPAGWFSSSPSSAACTICPFGTYSASASSSECLECERGKYQPSNGGTTCIACPTGTFSALTRQQACAPCSSGFYSNSTGAQQCESCLAGQYQPQLGASVCRQCPAGTFTDSPNKPSCTPCSAGQFASNRSSQACAPCDAGTYSVLPRLTLDSVDKSIVNLGPTFCTQCPPGSSTATTSSATCQLCSAGKFANEYGQPTCEECPAGRHASVEGQPNCQLCPPGTATASQSSIDCTQCNPGSFQDNAGRETCLTCAGGTYQNALGGSTCIDCPAGKFSLNSSTTCSDCAAGRFNGLTRQTECVQCPRGFHQPVTGATACLACAPRTAAESPGLSTCDPCKVGTYASEYNTTECPSCPPGTFQGSNGQSACAQCQPGTWSATGATTCPSCTDPAKFSDIFGATTCSQCPTNQLANDAHTSCECQPGLFFGYPFQVYAGQPLGSTQNDYDQIAQRIAAELTAESGRNVSLAQDCQTCPEGADCRTKGTRYLTMGTLPGWWRADNQTLTFYQCLQEQQCIGGRSSACATHRVGPICAVCEDGSRQNSRGACSPCSATFTVNVVLTCIISVCIVLAMCVMFFLVIRTDRPQMRFVKLQQRLEHEQELAKSGALDDAHHNQPQSPSSANGSSPKLSAGFSTAASPTNGAAAAAAGNTTATNTTGEVQLLVDPKAGASAVPVSGAAGGVAVAKGGDGGASTTGRFNEDGEFETDSYRPSAKPNLTYKLKIVVGFFQIATCLMSSLNMPWPLAFREFINFFNFFNLDFLQWESIGCAASPTYYVHLVVATLIPIVIVAAIVLFYLLPYYWTHRPTSTPPPGVSAAEHAWAMDAGRKRQRRRVWKLVLFTLFLVYPRVSSTVLSMYVCQTVEGVTYVQSDFTQICYDDVWKQYLGWNLVCLVLYPIGVPLFFLYLLLRYRQRLHEASVKVELGFLYDGYDKDAWYFELLDLGHKLVLSALLPFLPLDAQMPFGMCVVVVYMAVIFLRKPYARKSDDRLHLFAQIELLLLMVAGYVFYKETDDEYGQFEDDLIGAWLILIVCLFIVGFLAQSLRIIQKLLQRSLDGTVDPDTVVTDQMDDRTRGRAQATLAALAKLTGKQTRKQGVRHTAASPRPKWAPGGSGGAGATGAIEMGVIASQKPREDDDVLMTRNPVAGSVAATANTTANTTADLAPTVAAAAPATDSGAAAAAPAVEGSAEVSAAVAPIVLNEIPAASVGAAPAADGGAAIAPADVQLSMGGSGGGGADAASAAPLVLADGSTLPAGTIATPVSLVEVVPLTALNAMPVLADAGAAPAAADAAVVDAAPIAFVAGSSVDPPPYSPTNASAAADAPVAASAASVAPVEAAPSAAADADADARAKGHDSDSDDDAQKARRRKDSDE